MKIESLIDGLSDNAIKALPYLFDVWGIPGHQLPPEGRWRTWLILGGRGAGKTRAGAEWVRSRVEGRSPREPGFCRRIGLVAATMDEARDVMIMGDSGILACTPPDRRPVWRESGRKLTWPNGAEAVCYSAGQPEKLRGPQFDAAWADEVGKWRKPKKTWDNLQFALRLGDQPQQVVTTTPRANPVLEALLDNSSTRVVSAPTWSNAANLAAQFLEEVTATYGGTDQGREELEGEMVLDRAGALWTRAMLADARLDCAPELERIVVAVDPPATSGDGADECGIIVAGCAGSPPKAYVLADLSSAGETPSQWGKRAIAAYEAFEADRVVAEVNQGGEMVENVLRNIDPDIPYTAVRAIVGKRVRAEPISALYEQGRVHHVGDFRKLEDQMRAFGSDDPMSRSPDRVDALVWAITELIAGKSRRPAKVRVL